MGVLDRLPTIVLALAATVTVAALAAFLTRRRGGRFRGLGGWFLFWVGFAILLVLASRTPHWVGFLLLAGLMFATLRAYFFLAPVRPADRRAIIASYIAIPLVLWATFAGSTEMFLATVPVLLFLLAPLFVSMGKRSEGLLDSIGRTLLGVLFFIFCTAHLGLLVQQRPGLVELWGVLVLGTELSQRLVGRFRPGEGRLRPSLGILASLLVAGVLGFMLGPTCGLSDEDGGRAGVLVALAVSFGAVVSDAVARDLELSSSNARLGRGAILDRMIPAVYAAPVFYHYLDHFV
jgi:predicted CDP-diglyceride synthetase/phosphatidate cytidylyltransferase